MSDSAMRNWMVIAYRKICEADLIAQERKLLLPRRFELHQGLPEAEARRIFDLYKQSPQILAAELYGTAGLIDRHDPLMDLARLDASGSDYLRACWAPRGTPIQLPS